MKTTDPSLPKAILQYEGNTYNNLGLLAFKERTKESAKIATEHFEKMRDICEEMDDAEGVAVAESNFAAAKSRYTGIGEYVEETLEQRQKLYKQDGDRFGQDELATIDSGVHLSYALANAHHKIEAERLLIKLAAISKRAHGPDHNMTKRVESELQKRRERYVFLNHQNEIHLFQALRYEEDGGKCVVQGPIENPRNIQAEQTFTVPSNDIKFILGTPVICDGLKKATHLNGKIGDLRSWHEESGCFKVHFDDNNIEPCTVKNEFLQILFDLPEES